MSPQPPLSCLLLGTRCSHDSAKLFAAAARQATTGHRIIVLHLGRLEAKAQSTLVRVEVRLHRHGHSQRILEEALGGNLAHVGAQTLECVRFCVHRKGGSAKVVPEC